MPDVAPVGFRLRDGAIGIGGLDVPKTVNGRNVLRWMPPAPLAGFGPEARRGRVGNRP